MEDPTGSRKHADAHREPTTPRGQAPNGTKIPKNAKKPSVPSRAATSPSQVGNPGGVSQNSGGVKLNQSPKKKKASTTSKQAKGSWAASEAANALRHTKQQAPIQGQRKPTEDTAVSKPPTRPFDEQTRELITKIATLDVILSQVPKIPEGDTQIPAVTGGTTCPIGESVVIAPDLGSTPQDVVMSILTDLGGVANTAIGLGAGLHAAKNSNQLLNPATIVALHHQARALGQLSKRFADIAETAVIARLMKVAGPPEPQLWGVVGRLRKEIGEVSRTVEANNSSTDHLWKTAEECFRQAYDPSGTLHLEKFLESEEVPTMSASDWHREYGMGTVEEDIQTDMSPKTPKQLQESWIGFWARVANKCPGGPTLFKPTQFGPSASDVSYMFPFSTDLPRYLFRVVDSATLCGESPDVAASPMWLSTRDQPEQADATIDLLSQDTFVAAHKLRRHLTNSSLDGEDDDNLVSWSSSLPYALQTAVYRGMQRSCANTDVRICVVDTTQFPTGQFVRDRWLLKAYRDTAVARAERKWFDSRLDDQASYHGEFLSQGKMNLKGRSSICTLQALVDVGLKDMYPAFFTFPMSSSTRKDCDDRVTELRREWATRCKSTTKDIEHALAMAQTFEPPVDQMEVAIQLMAFKNRMIYMRSRPNDSVEKVRADDPVETRRYQEWTPMIKSGARQQGGRAALEKLFWLTPKSLKDRYRQNLESKVQEPGCDSSS